jgi:hypothetical protein
VGAEAAASYSYAVFSGKRTNSRRPQTGSPRPATGRSYQTYRGKVTTATEEATHLMEGLTSPTPPNRTFVAPCFQVRFSGPQS